MRRISTLIVAATLTIACNESKEIYHIIPHPNHIEAQSDYFYVSERTDIVIPEDMPSDMQQEIDLFCSAFSNTTGFLPKIGKSANTIYFERDTTIAPEGYVLDIDTRNVKVKASTAAGIFYAHQTIRQLLPAEIFDSSNVSNVKWKIKCAYIEDSPRFAYRGMHLDEARHFFGMKEVKRYIDIMAMHKINTLHWHLTDDQGWRIEIKSYPKLTTVGSIRNRTMVGKQWDTFDNTPYGGYYTQDQIREIIAYAARKHITVIPEIDLPGHMVAALASYPELGCTGGPYEVSPQWGVLDDVLCVGKENTMQFLENALSEIVELFPSEYIHIGGDECPKVRWEKCPRCQAKIRELGLKDDDKFKKEHYLQSYVTARIEQFLAKHNRRIIGWDEILEGDLSPNATVMSWRGVVGGIEAANKGHDVIMTPNNYMYLDYCQSLNADKEPLGIGSYLPVKKVYSYEPLSPELDSSKHKHILGVQANLWTEYIATPDHLEYMLLPRMAALSEVQWTQPQNKDFERFMLTMPTMAKRYEKMGYNYAKHVFDIIPEYTADTVRHAVLVDLKGYGDCEIRYTLDGSEPNNSSTLFTNPFYVESNTKLRATITRTEPQHTSTMSEDIVFDKSTCRNITLNTLPTKKHSYNGALTLIDGLRGTIGLTTGRWLGYSGSTFDVTIDMGKPTECSLVTLGTISRMNDWVFPPTQIEIQGSDDGTTFRKLSEMEISDWKDQRADEIIDYTLNFEPATLRSIRVVAQPLDTIPDWHQSGKGEKGFIFVDEIMVK